METPICLLLFTAGKRILVPKGREDSARGFNPWLAIQHAPALKGRQKFLIERSSVR